MNTLLLGVVLAVGSIVLYSLVIWLCGKFLKEEDILNHPFKPGDGGVCMTQNQEFTVAAVGPERLYCAGWPLVGYLIKDCMRTFSCDNQTSKAMIKDCLGLPEGDTRRTISEGLMEA